MKSYNETELIRGCVLGEERAATILITYHYKSVLTAIICRGIHDTALAEDLTQETFIKVINLLKQGKYDNRNKFRAWLLRIATNVAVDYLRKKNRDPLIFEDSQEHANGERGEYSVGVFQRTASDYKNPEEETTWQVDCVSKHLPLLDGSIILNELLSQIPVGQKNVLTLRFFEEKSFKEIAEMESIPVNTALARARYGLRNLRKLLADNIPSLRVSNMILNA